jgi:serine kinase of HPr protein (carbohydrate metabolism regulator)
MHATSIAVGRRAGLFIGPSGSGKSDLALRCLATPASMLLPQAASLIADDQTVVRLKDGRLEACAPETIRNRLEIRGIGLFTVPACDGAEVCLVFDLERGPIERLAELPQRMLTILGCDIPVIRLAAFEASAPAKVLMALTHPTCTDDNPAKREARGRLAL